MLYKLSPNLVHRGPMARQNPSSNLMTVTLFKMATYARWFPRKISEEMFDVCPQKHQGKAKTKMNWLNLTLFSRSQRPFKMFFAQYLEKYLMCRHQIWYREAPGQGEEQVQTLWPWPNFQGHDYHLCKSISAQILASPNSGQECNVGKSKTKLWPGDLDLHVVLKATKVVLAKIVSHIILRNIQCSPSRFSTGMLLGTGKSKFELSRSRKSF